MAIASFRDLRVWQQGVLLVEQIYLFTQVFPKDETFGLVSQLRRIYLLRRRRLLKSKHKSRLRNA